MPLDSIASTVGRLVSGGHLAPGALVVVERPAGSEELVALGPLAVDRTRRYGGTMLVFASADPLAEEQ
jgi:hypothetical protein